MSEPGQPQNDEIFSILQAARRQVVKFIDRHDLQRVMRVRSTERTATMMQRGFSLTVTAQCYPIEGEPAILDLVGTRDNMGLRRSGETYAAIWKRDIWEGVSFFIANEGANMSQRWSFGYRIVVPIDPYIPGRNNPSQEEQERFILKILYEPVLRSIRPIGMTTRLV